MAGSTPRSAKRIWNKLGTIMKVELKMEDKFITQ